MEHCQQKPFYLRTCLLNAAPDNGNMNTVSPPRSLVEAWAKWVAAALQFAKDNAGLKRDDVAARLSTIDGSGLSKIVKGGRKLTAPEVTEISLATGYPMPVELGVVSIDIMTEFVPLQASVSAGIWREESKPVPTSMLRVREIYEPAYAGLKQHGRLLLDNHADLYAPKGFYVICVEYHAAKTALNDGDVVVIQRLQPIPGDNLIEETVRSIARRDGEWFLDPLTESGEVEPIPYAGETDTLRIVDLVIAAYKPSPRA